MPEAWKQVTLGDAVMVALSSVDKHIIPGEASVHLCNYLDVYRHRRLSREMPFSRGSATPAEIARFTLQRGDVVITKDSETPDDIGIPAVVVDDLAEVVCGYHLALLRPTRQLASNFLLHYLQSDAAKRHFLRMANGLTRFGLGLRAISSLPIPLPSPGEQAVIARILDAVDTALERTRTAVAGARNLRASILVDVLRHGVGKDGKVRRDGTRPSDFVVTPLGRLPAVWRLSVVEREFHLQNGFTLNAERRARFKKRRYLRVANVQRDALDLTDVQELEAGDLEFAPRVLASDDLLVVEGHADRMAIGRCARVTEHAAGMTFQNHLFRLRTRGAVEPAFACLWLNSAYAQRFWNARSATSSGLNTINQRMLKRLIVPVPSEPEQQSIASIVAQQRQHLEALIAKEASLEALKRALMHDLLTGRVRVPNEAKAVAS